MCGTTGYKHTQQDPERFAQRGPSQHALRRRGQFAPPRARSASSCRRRRRCCTAGADSRNPPAAVTDESGGAASLSERGKVAAASPPAAEHERALMRVAVGPQAPQEAVRALDAALRIHGALLRRPGEHREETRGVRAVLLPRPSRGSTTLFFDFDIFSMPPSDHRRAIRERHRADRLARARRTARQLRSDRTSASCPTAPRDRSIR